MSSFLFLIPCLEHLTDQLQFLYSLLINYTLQIYYTLSAMNYPPSNTHLASAEGAHAHALHCPMAPLSLIRAPLYVKHGIGVKNQSWLAGLYWCRLPLL